MGRSPGFLAIAALCLLMQTALSFAPAGARVLCLGDCRSHAHVAAPHVHAACDEHSHEDEGATNLPRPMRSGESGGEEDCLDILLPDDPRRVEVAAQLPDLTPAPAPVWAYEVALLLADSPRAEQPSLEPVHPPGLVVVCTTRLRI